jgi:hypothetical protein
VDKATFSSEAKVWVGAGPVAVQLELVMEKLLDLLKADGWRVTTRVAKHGALDDARCQHERGALLADPVFGNCQVQAEFLVDWNTGPVLVLAAYGLAPGADPLPAKGGDDEALLLSALVGADHLNWHIMTAAHTADYLARWLEAQHDKLPVLLAEFRDGLDEALSP